MRNLLVQQRSLDSLLTSNITGISFVEVIDQLQQCRLADTVAAEQSNPLPGLYLQINAVEERRPAKAKADFLQTDECHCSR